MKSITISAFSADYTDRSYKFFYGNGNFELVPKSQVRFLEAAETGSDFGDGIQSRYFELPMSLFNKLKGINYYSIV
jgi:hypothetical protein